MVEHDAEAILAADHVVEVPRDALQLALQVAAQRRGDLDVVAADIEIHRTFLRFMGNSFTGSFSG
ncbi:hypothetical protein D3C83_226670 [compost metagenome]